MKNADKSALFLHWWKLLGTAEQPVPEYKFDAEIGRKHRFDWAFVERKVAIEIDGGQYAHQGGRHNTDGDREKLNIAAMLGWRVFRFSPTMLQNDPQTCVDMVKNSMKEELR